ncbi:MAG TPA: tetratricopeptide repeat protein [Candidatus Binataceae bacterium]|nr:tetratricopeptide repeat protein [Candidatus Binataceae bacterium]
MSLPPADIPVKAGAFTTGVAEFPAGASEAPRSVKVLPILFVLVLGTEIPLRPVAGWIVTVLSRFGWSLSTILGLNSVITQTVITVVILLVVHFWERLPMRSIGIAKLAVCDLVLGIAGFLAVVLVEVIILPRVLSILTGSPGWRIAAMDARQFALIAKWSWPMVLATAMSAGIFEEVWARGYGVERLEGLTRGTLAAATITLVLDLGAHVPFWGLRYAVLIAPSQMVMLGLYLWRRRLIPCVIAHVLWDAGRPILVALIWLLAMIAPMHATRGWQALSRGDYDRSITEFSIVLSRTPNNLRALEGRSNAYWYKGKYDQSIEDLNKVVRLDPGSKHAYWNRANAYLDKHDYPRAMADANQAIKLAPENPDTYSMRSYVEAATGDDSGAIRDLGRSIELAPGDRALLYRREALCDTSGDYQGAITDLGRLLARDPGSRRYLLGERARLYGITGQFALASLDDSAIISADPKDTAGYTIGAYLSYQQHQYGAAIDDLNKAIALAPDRTRFYTWRAIAFWKLGNRQLAIADWRRVLAKKPSDVDQYNDNAWLLATNPMAAIRDGKRAVEFAIRSCGSSGWKNAEYLDTLAAACAENGDFAGAVRWENKALTALDPSAKTSAADMRKRLVLYEAGRPYRDTYPSLF